MITNEDILATGLLGDPSLCVECPAFKRWLDRHNYTHDFQGIINEWGELAFLGGAMAHEEILNQVATFHGIEPKVLLEQLCDIARTWGGS